MSLAISFVPPEKGSLLAFHVAHSSPSLSLLVTIPDGSPEQAFCKDGSSLACPSPRILAAHTPWSWSMGVIWQIPFIPRHHFLPTLQMPRFIQVFANYLLAGTYSCNCLVWVNIPTSPLCLSRRLQQLSYGVMGVSETFWISSLSSSISCPYIPIENFFLLGAFEKPPFNFLSHHWAMTHLDYLVLRYVPAKAVAHTA